MSESFSDRPAWAAKSCCEEAALNAAEVVRLHDEFAALADELEERADAQELGHLPNAPGLALIKRDAATRIRAVIERGKS